MSYEPYRILLPEDKNEAAKEVNHFIDMIKEEPEPEWQSQPRSALILMGKPALETIVKALDTAPEHLRFNLAWVLGKIGDAEAVPYLLKLLDDTDFVRSRAAWALGKIGDKSVANTLYEYIIHQKIQPWWAIQALKDLEATTELKNIVANTNLEDIIREIALEALETPSSTQNNYLDFLM